MFSVHVENTQPVLQWQWLVLAVSRERFVNYSGALRKDDSVSVVD